MWAILILKSRRRKTQNNSPLQCSMHCGHVTPAKHTSAQGRTSRTVAEPIKLKENKGVSIN